MTTKNPATPKANVDWELIERHFRAGLLSLREICAEHLAATGVSITDTAIRKRAKKDGWERDLKAKIQQRTEELVRKETVRMIGSQTDPVRTTLTPADEKETIEANAKVGVAVRMAQRNDAQRLRSLARKLMGEVEATTDNQDLFNQLGELLDESGPDSNGTWRKDKRNEIYMKVISLSGRVDDVKKLSDILEKLQKMEGDSYGLAGETQSSPLDEVLKKLHRERTGS